MHSHQITERLTIEAGEAITGKRFVTLDGKHTADSKAAGVAEFDTDSGDQISVIRGIVTVEASGSITALDYVSMDANGKAASLTISAVSDIPKICGRALDAATDDGDFIRVQIL